MKTEAIDPAAVYICGQGRTPRGAILDAVASVPGFRPVAEPADQPAGPSSCRTAFEAWAASAGVDLVRWEGGGYFEDATARLWAAWKAARVWADANQNTASAEPHHKEGEHVLYKTGDPDCPDAIKDRNGEVVLHECRLCGGAEATMPTQCPGVKMTAVQQDAVMHGLLDFDEGTWLVPA